MNTKAQLELATEGYKRACERLQQAERDSERKFWQTQKDGYYGDMQRLKRKLEQENRGS